MERPLGSTSSGTSSSFSGLDMDAKALADKQYDAALSLFPGLRDATNSNYTSRLGSLSDAFNASIASQQTYGGAERNRLYRDFGNAQRSVGQGLAQRGLYNTTMKGVGEQKVQRDRNTSLGNLDDILRQQLSQLMLQRNTALDGIEADRLRSLVDLDLQKSAIMAAKAGTLPTYSESTSSNQSSG